MNNEQRNYWFQRNVFITGINGFIGGNMARRLLSLGANVYGLLRNAKPDTLLFYEHLNHRITLIEGELTDRDLLARIVSEERIQVVFHLAAQVEVGVGLANPYLTFETNVRGTYSLLEGIRQCRGTIESVVIASTDKSYGSYPRDRMPYKEDYPLHPKYPYDVSKACADMIAQCYATDAYNLPIIVTRFCNIYGPGQLNFSAVVPDSVRACLGYGTFVPRGDGTQVRDFIFVDDVVDLYLRIGEGLAANPAGRSGQIYNAGTNSPLSVRQVLETVYRLCEQQSAFRDVVAAMDGKRTVGEIDCQYMDYEKVNQHFGWAPKHSFESGVKKTIDWFDRYLADKHVPVIETADR